MEEVVVEEKPKKEKKKKEKPKKEDFNMSEFVPKVKKVELKKIEDDNDLPLLERIIRARVGDGADSSKANSKAKPKKKGPTQAKDMFSANRSKGTRHRDERPPDVTDWAAELAK